MKKLGGVLLFVCLLFVAAPAFGSTIYDVSIYAAWTAAEVSLEIQPGGLGEPSPDPIVEQFVAQFDVYSNGDLVPGTMSFGSSGGYFSGGMYFGPPPPCGNEQCNELDYATPPQYSWSESTDSFGYFVEFLPISWPPTGSVTYSADQTVALDCLPQGNTGCALLGCSNLGCANGGTEWASYGTVAIQQIAETPEPGTLFLLLVGLVLTLLRREGHGMRPARPGRASYVLSC